MASLIFNWKRVEAESRILKQSSEHYFTSSKFANISLIALGPQMVRLPKVNYHVKGNIF